MGDAKFSVGDIVVPAYDLLAEHGTVSRVGLIEVRGEWREYIEVTMRDGYSGGNADLFVRVCKARGGVQRPTAGASGEE